MRFRVSSSRNERAPRAPSARRLAPARANERLRNRTIAERGAEERSRSPRPPLRGRGEDRCELPEPPPLAGWRLLAPPPLRGRGEGIGLCVLGIRVMVLRSRQHLPASRDSIQEPSSAAFPKSKRGGNRRGDALSVSPPLNRRLSTRDSSPPRTTLCARLPFIADVWLSTHSESHPVRAPGGASVVERGRSRRGPS